MRLVITGATGFIGQYLIEAAYQDFQIIALTRSTVKVCTHSNVYYTQTNYEVDSLQRILEEGDIIIHLAGYRLTKQDVNPKLSDFMDANVKLTENILIAATRVGVKKIVMSSTIGVYSNADQMPYSENIISTPSTVYGLSKLICEQLINYYSVNDSITATVLRFSQCYGVGEKDTPVLMKFIKLAREKKKITVQDNEYYLDEVYVKDVVNAILLVINNNISGTYNIGGGIAYSILQMSNIVNKVFNNNNFEIIPSKKVANTNNFLSVDKSLNELDWSPKFDLESGLVDMKNIYERNM